MKVNGVRVLEQRNLVIEIEDGEIRPKQWSRDGKVYRVDLLEPNWRRHDGGDWLLDTPRLRGQLLKKDGSNGAMRENESLTFRCDQWPEWVVALATEHAPSERGDQ